MWRQSALMIILKLVIGALVSINLIALSSVKLQFQNWFAPISLRRVFKIVEAYVMARGWSSCSSLIPLCGGFSICKAAHRIWLRMSSVALEKRKM